MELTIVSIAAMKRFLPGIERNVRKVDSLVPTEKDAELIDVFPTIIVKTNPIGFGVQMWLQTDHSHSIIDQEKISVFSRHPRNSVFTQLHLPRLFSLVQQSSTFIPSILFDYCNRTFYLHALNRSHLHCFCPPSYSVDRCQYDRRRVTLLLRVDREDRQEIPMMINVLVTLVQNKTTIVSHHFWTDFTRVSPDKHHLYLLYPRPHLYLSSRISLSKLFRFE